MSFSWSKQILRLGFVLIIISASSKTLVGDTLECTNNGPCLVFTIDSDDGSKKSYYAVIAEQAYALVDFDEAKAKKLFGFLSPDGPTPKETTIDLLRALDLQSNPKLFYWNYESTPPGERKIDSGWTVKMVMYYPGEGGNYLEYKRADNTKLYYFIPEECNTSGGLYDYFKFNRMIPRRTLRDTSLGVKKLACNIGRGQPPGPTPSEKDNSWNFFYYEKMRSYDDRNNCEEVSESGDCFKPIIIAEHVSKEGGFSYFGIKEITTQGLTVTPTNWFKGNLDTFWKEKLSSTFKRLFNHDGKLVSLTKNLSSAKKRQVLEDMRYAPVISFELDRPLIDAPGLTFDMAVPLENRTIAVGYEKIDINSFDATKDHTLKPGASRRYDVSFPGGTKVIAIDSSFSLSSDPKRVLYMFEQCETNVNLNLGAQLGYIWQNNEFLELSRSFLELKMIAEYTKFYDENELGIEDDFMSKFDAIRRYPCYHQTSCEVEVTSEATLKGVLAGKDIPAQCDGVDTLIVNVNPKTNNKISLKGGYGLDKPLTIAAGSFTGIKKVILRGKNPNQRPTIEYSCNNCRVTDLMSPGPNTNEVPICNYYSDFALPMIYVTRMNDVEITNLKLSIDNSKTYIPELSGIVARDSRVKLTNVDIGDSSPIPTTTGNEGDPPSSSVPATSGGESGPPSPPPIAFMEGVCVTGGSDLFIANSKVIAKAGVVAAEESRISIFGPMPPTGTSRFQVSPMANNWRKFPGDADNLTESVSIKAEDIGIYLYNSEALLINSDIKAGRKGVATSGYANIESHGLRLFGPMEKNGQFTATDPIAISIGIAVRPGPNIKKQSQLYFNQIELVGFEFGFSLPDKIIPVDLMPIAKIEQDNIVNLQSTNGAAKDFHQGGVFDCSGNCQP